VTKGWVGFGTWLARTGIITLSRTGPFREKVTNWAAELLLNSLYTEKERLYLVRGTRQTLCAAAGAPHGSDTRHDGQGNTVSRL
jgi:hypothetical protein